MSACVTVCVLRQCCECATEARHLQSERGIQFSSAVSALTSVRVRKRAVVLVPCTAVDASVSRAGFAREAPNSVVKGGSVCTRVLDDSTICAELASRATRADSGE
jgi:hypothetical protein